MTVSSHLQRGLTDRTRVKILTVDPVTHRIEATMKDGYMITIAVWDVPHVFRWPKENEVWIVRRDDGIWTLDHRQQQAKDETTMPLASMAPGEMVMDSDTIMDATGKTLVAVDLTGIEDGHTLKWDATLKSFVASP